MKQQQQQIAEWSPLERMIQQQVVERGIRDERVLEALRGVPRDRFFTEDAQAEAYALFALEPLTPLLRRVHATQDA